MKRIIGITLITVSVITAVLAVIYLKGGFDQRFNTVSVVNSASEISTYEGDNILISGKFVMKATAYDDETGLRFKNPLVIKTEEREYADEDNHCVWREVGEGEKYYAGSVYLNGILVDKSLLKELIGSELVYPTEKSMEARGYGVYTFGDNREYIAPIYDFEAEGDFTGRIRLSYNGVEYHKKSLYSVIGYYDGKSISKSDLGIEKSVFEGDCSLKDIKQSALSVNKTIVAILFCLSAVMLLAGMYIIVKSVKFGKKDEAGD